MMWKHKRFISNRGAQGGPHTDSDGTTGHRILSNGPANLRPFDGWKQEDFPKVDSDLHGGGCDHFLDDF